MGRPTRVDLERFVYDELAKSNFLLHVPWSIWSSDTALANMRALAIAESRCAQPAESGANELCGMPNGHSGKHAPELAMEARAQAIEAGTVKVSDLYATGP